MPETSKTVTNALRVLDCFTREAPVMTVSALARRLGLPRTSILRLISTLEGFRLLERTADGGCRLGLRAFELGGLYLAGNPALALIAQALDGLVEATQCTAYLGVLQDDDVLILMCREGSLPVRFLWQAGSRLPCTTTALGKAILMHLPPAEMAARFADRPLRTLTPNSLRRYEDLERDLAAARRRGWTLVREESHAGLTAVGAALLDEAGCPVAGISLSLLDHPRDRARLERLAATVRDEADQLSTRLSPYRDYGVRLAPETRHHHAQGPEVRTPLLAHD